MAIKAPAQTKRSGKQTQLELTGETLLDREHKLKALLEAGKRIHENYPEIGPREAARLLDPIERKAYSLRETAEIIGISTVTLYRLVKRKKIRPITVLRHMLFTMDEINRFLQLQELTPAA